MGRLAEGLRGFWMPGLPTRDPALTQYLGGGPTTSGSSVSEYSALNYSAWWSAVQIIANAVSSLPLFLYKRLPGAGKERFTAHRVYRLLHDEFNPEMTSTVARKTMQAHVLTWGNAYAEIQRTNGGEPFALWPLKPDLVTPDRSASGGIIYRIKQKTGPDEIISAEDMLHIPGLGFDGLMGYSVVKKARETIGLGLATEKFGAQFFGNGAISGLVAMHPGPLSQTAKENLKNSIVETIGGDKKHSVIVLEEGMKVEKTSIPPNDAQFLESRAFGIREVARWFNIPPHKLGDLDRATFSNIEHQAIEFVTDCLRPWLVAWEQELNRKLIRPLERNIQYTEHLVDALLRGDLPSRYAAYAVGRQWGWLSANRICDFENLDPLPGAEGDIFLVPMNMVPADRLDDVINAQTRPPATPSPAPMPSGDPAANQRIEKIVEDLRQEVAAHLVTVEAQLAESTSGTQSILDGVRVAGDAVITRIAEIPVPDPLPIVKAVEEAQHRILGAAQSAAAEIRETHDELQALRGDVTNIRADGVGTREALEATTAAVTDLAAAVPRKLQGLGDRLAKRLEDSSAAIIGNAEVVRESTSDVVTRTGDELKTLLTTVEELHRVKRAAVAIVAGTLVRRELDRAKVIAKDPAKAEGLADFYARRIVQDGVRILAPLDDRPAVLEHLNAWAAAACDELARAVGEGTTDEIPGRWAERHEAMTTMLLEAIDGPR